MSQHTSSMPQRNDNHVEEMEFVSLGQLRDSRAEDKPSQRPDGPTSFEGSPTPNAAMYSSTTIAPSPPSHLSTLQTSDISNSSLQPLDTSASSHLHPSLDTLSRRSPLSASLRISTDIIPGYMITAASATNTGRSSGEFAHLPLQPVPIKRTPSIKNALISSLGSSTNLGSMPSSALSSPMLNAMHMPDVTPLPSPLMTGDSPGPWKKLVERPTSRDLTIPHTADSALVTANGESISAAIANQSKRRAYHNLITHASESPSEKTGGHRRERSISEYVPDAIPIPKLRHITVSGSHPSNDSGTPDSASSVDGHLRREPHLSIQRGHPTIPRPPTPPPSHTGADSGDDGATSIKPVDVGKPPEFFDARTRGDSKLRRWRSLRQLGTGTFSKVMLATSQLTEKVPTGGINTAYPSMQGVVMSNPEVGIDRKTLVAVKICEQGAKGGADEDRIDMSLKRELEIMRSVHHPSLVHLRAWNVESTRAILVLSYCPGGDLFDVASQRQDLLIPSLLRRMFSEIVGAVRYLHSAHIVHRDIKLENVLVNLEANELAQPRDWANYPYSVITLTDLGLSRRVTDEQKLTTRCGSDDYAAPEVILGQDYDGRAIDAWSLGVLLYALLESRLPFDPHPKMTALQQERNRVSHRIARVDYIWIKYFGEEGDHEYDPAKFEEAGLTGAFVVTDGLLRRTRNRWTMDKLAEYEWVKGGITIQGGIQFREEDTPEEVRDIDSSPI